MCSRNPVRADDGFSVLHARAAMKMHVSHMRVVLPRGYGRTSSRRNVQASIPPPEKHPAIGRPNAGTAAHKFRKARTFILAFLAPSGHGRPTVSKNDPAGGKIAHPLEP